MTKICLEDWKKSTWDFLMEHTKILPSGKIRIIFDTDGRDNFEKRVYARARGYHRGDPDTRYKKSQEKREQWVSEKQIKKIQYRADKTERKRKQNAIKFSVFLVGEYNTFKLSPFKYICKKVLNMFK